MDQLLFVLYLCLGLNILMFIPAYLWHTDKLTDISYAVSFILSVLLIAPWSEINLPAGILICLVSLWALRLGIYLLIRIHTMGRDSRFDVMRRNFWQFFRFWLLQAITVWIVLIPSIWLLQRNPETLDPSAFLALIIFILGLLIETMADYQKFTFNNKPEHKGLWISSGLWRYSRHPNYLGEIMVWLGVYLYCLTALTPWQALFAFISPLYITILLLFVSGLPLLEKAADARWGNNAEYQEYKKRTGTLLPKL